MRAVYDCALGLLSINKQCLPERILTELEPVRLRACMMATYNIHSYYIITTQVVLSLLINTARKT